MARVIYGVMTITNGHLTRAQAIARRLPEHEFLFVGGERLREAVGEEYRVLTVPVLETVRRNNRAHVSATCWQGAGCMARLPRVCRRIKDTIEQWQPHVAITDREFFLPIAARASGLPCLSIDHHHIVSACRYPVPASQRMPHLIFRFCHGLFHSFAHRNLVVSFFHPPLKNPGRDELLPAILRPEVTKTSPVAGEHVLVYQTTPTFTPLIEAVRQLKRPVIVYGFRNEHATVGNVVFKPFDRRAILEDLAGCAYAVVNGGHNLICEAFYYRKPVLCFPIKGEFEQFLNVWHVRQLGCGDYSTSATPGPGLFQDFEKRLEDYRGGIDRQFRDGTAEVVERVGKVIQAHDTLRPDHRRAAL